MLDCFRVPFHMTSMFTIMPPPPFSQEYAVFFGRSLMETNNIASHTAIHRDRLWKAGCSVIHPQFLKRYTTLSPCWTFQLQTPTKYCDTDSRQSKTFLTRIRYLCKNFQSYTDGILHLPLSSPSLFRFGLI